MVDPCQNAHWQNILSNWPHWDYIKSAGFPAMAINVLWNKQSGPGGGTRRLHHFSLIVAEALIAG
jgi:hypothetical protein